MKQQIIEKCESLLGYRKLNSMEIWVILYQNKPIKLISGKSTWLRKRFAVSAMTNYLSRHFIERRDNITAKEVTQLLIKNKIIEIKQIL